MGRRRFLVLTVTCLVFPVLLGCSPGAIPVESPRGRLATSGTDDNAPVPMSKVDGESSTTSEKRPRSPSLLQILACPAWHHGKKVVISGFLRLEFEGTAIYLSEDDEKHCMTCNALWVSFEGNTTGMTIEDIVERFSGKYVYLSGTFDESDHGHLGAYDGAIKNITDIQVQLDRAELKRLKEEWFRKAEEKSKERGGPLGDPQRGRRKRRLKPAEIAAQLCHHHCVPLTAWAMRLVGLVPTTRRLDRGLFRCVKGDSLVLPGTGIGKVSRPRLLSCPMVQSLPGRLLRLGPDRFRPCSEQGVSP